MTRTIERFNLNEITAFRITCKCGAVYEIDVGRVAYPLGQNGTCIHCTQRLVDPHEDSPFLKLHSFFQMLRNQDGFTIEAEVPPAEEG